MMRYIARPLLKHYDLSVEMNCLQGSVQVCADCYSTSDAFVSDYGGFC